MRCDEMRWDAPMLHANLEEGSSASSTKELSISQQGFSFS